jgi:hypothetical protein
MFHAQTITTNITHTEELEDWEIEANTEQKTLAKKEDMDLTVYTPRSPVSVTASFDVRYQQRRLLNKTWKGINRATGKVTGEALMRLFYLPGMRQRWNKTYRGRFPTWRGIGSKWQGLLSRLVQDIYMQLPRHKDIGDYHCCAWAEGIQKPLMVVYTANIKRYPPHLKQILASLIDDRRRLDWNDESVPITYRK